MKTTYRLLFVSAVALISTAVAGAATAQENWTKDCQKCHAADGSASGPMGKKLKLKDYTNADVQAAMTDDDIVKAIKEGVKDEKTGKMAMPAYADKYTEEDIAALRDLIRGFKK